MIDSDKLVDSITLRRNQVLYVAAPGLYVKHLKISDNAEVRNPGSYPILVGTLDVRFSRPIRRKRSRV